MYKVFDDKTFYPAFAEDLHHAQALVWIQSPYLSESRINKLEAQLAACIKRRVRVCTFVQRPLDKERIASVEKMASRLTKVGVHVTFRPFIHEKLAVIDESILWDGSLNILSQSRSAERMLRWTDQSIVFETIVKHHLNTCEKCPKVANYPNATTESEQLRLIGEIVARRRKHLQLSQYELARQLGVHQTAISHIESGKRAARIGTLLRVCNELNLDLRPVPRYFVPALNDACR